MKTAAAVVDLVHSAYHAAPFISLPKVKGYRMRWASTRRRIALALSLLAAFNSILCSAAIASPMQYEFGGFITQADPSTGVAPGTHFSGTFAYDPAKLFGGFSIEGFSEANYGLSVNWPGSVADGSALTL